MLRGVRSTRVNIPYVHTDGTDISDIRHRIQQFPIPKCYMANASISVKNGDFFKNFFFAKKYIKNPFE